MFVASKRGIQAPDTMPKSKAAKQAPGLFGFSLGSCFPCCVEEVDVSVRSRVIRPRRPLIGASKSKKKGKSTTKLESAVDEDLKVESPTFHSERRIPVADKAADEGKKLSDAGPGEQAVKSTMNGLFLGKIKAKFIKAAAAKRRDSGTGEPPKLPEIPEGVAWAPLVQDLPIRLERYYVNEFKAKCQRLTAEEICTTTRNGGHTFMFYIAETNAVNACRIILTELPPESRLYICDKKNDRGKTVADLYRETRPEIVETMESMKNMKNSWQHKGNIIPPTPEPVAFRGLNLPNQTGSSAV